LSRKALKTPQRDTPVLAADETAGFKDLDLVAYQARREIEIISASGTNSTRDWKTVGFYIYDDQGNQMGIESDVQVPMGISGVDNMGVNMKRPHHGYGFGIRFYDPLENDLLEAEAVMRVVS